MKIKIRTIRNERDKKQIFVELNLLYIDYNE
jgi:hypothetical protein